MNQSNAQTRGRIFDIQRFSVHDGPGIRTIVFLKGCVLRCRWCCNPEGQKYEIQTMNMDGKEKIVGRDVTVAEILPEILADKPYYRRSGGGLTLSGGEVLCQPDFAAALLQAAQEEGLSTAIESTGCAPWSSLEKVLPWLDHYLMDIKHMDSKKHEAFTSRPNERILENAKRIARDASHLIIRTPVIPTFNDTVEEIGAIADFASSLEGVSEMHILPYHKMGTDKYVGLGREYLLPDLVPRTKEHMQKLLEVVQSKGLYGQIGG